MSDDKVLAPYVNIPSLQSKFQKKFFKKKIRFDMQDISKGQPT